MTTTTAPRVLAVAAHADDEILGAGGALAEHSAHGADLCFLILSTSALSRPDSEHAAVNDHRRRCAQAAAERYGATLVIADLPDNGFDTVAQLTITQHIEAVIREFAPTLVYTHSTADLSRDHQLVAQATAAATRPQPGASVRTVLAYEVRSATDWGIGTPFRPSWFQELSPVAVEQKLSTLTDVYGSEMRPWPHTRSEPAIRALLTHRGAQCGAHAAEAFEVLRHMP
ncbi:PIG-L deacetylase family protein [Streptomyces sp. NPDC021100]|uniref:PIG-L deacetylase family protein n=1 Tax=Streptomyces sp. NPDC021100 TaxID=3365114 RepID=UPI0037943A3C